ncbi:MAG TPA: HD domain-containing protein [Bryobacteraceae bacterium]|jgi:hypothetical protein|nr:HD domain-containing protein [Bryobacteraceae bacterium]
MDLSPFPKEAEDLLAETNSHPRLRAHLVLVHDVACQLTAHIHRAWPHLALDEKLVHLGAAIHDIGKTVHPQELSEPGHLHEAAGRRLLLEHGWAEKLARFTVTHGGDFGVNDPLEDLLVAAADKVWKGKRDDALEQALVHRIATLSGDEPWQVWLAVDDILTRLAEAAPERLRWHASHGV